MTLGDHMAQVQLKLDRADKHIGDLERATVAFTESHPYRVVPKHDPDTGQYIHKPELLRPIPQEIALVAGDAIHNLRSALDHMIGRFAIAADINDSQREALIEKTAFPTAKTEANYIKEVQAKAGFGPEALSKKLLGYKCYSGGDNTLYALHQLDIIDKHRALILGFASIGAIRMLLIPGDPESEIIGLTRPNSGLNRADKSKGMVLDEPHPDLKFDIKVSLNEAGPLDRREIAYAVGVLATLTSKIVRDLKPVLRAFINAGGRV